MISLSLKNIDVDRIEKAKKSHDTRWLDVKDVKYQEIVVSLRKIISNYCRLNGSNGIGDELIDLCKQKLQSCDLLSKTFEPTLIEVLYYEYKFREKN